MSTATKRTLPRAWLLLIVVVTSAASGAAGAVVAYRSILDLFADWPELAGTPPLPMFHLLDFLPAGAMMAALSLLCTSIGTQLLHNSPWISLVALGAITAVLLGSLFIFAYEQEPLTVATIWAGTTLMWCATLWSTRPERTALAPVRVSAPRASSTAGMSSTDLGVLPTAEHTWTDTDTSKGDLRRATRRAATALVVVMETMILALIALTAANALQMYFHGQWPSWDSVGTSTPALLASLAIWSAWLAGRGPADPRSRTWLVITVAALALAAIEGLVDSVTGAVAIPVLAALGVTVAYQRHRVADRLQLLLSP